MTVKSIRQAINEALAHEMRRDPRVVVIGEDVSGGAGTDGQRDAYGGVLGVTKGLIAEFGEARVIDTPITESAIMGAAAGAAVTGLRPVAELMFSDFLGVCFDQIFNQAAKFRYMFGGKAKTPLVIRTMIGAGRSAAAQHSQSPYHIFTSVPGLKCVVPSNAYDAKGLLIQAIRDDDPVIFCEHKLMYDLKTEVPDEAYTIPFGEANIVRDGDDVTIVALARMVHYATEAADLLEKEGISCELIDPRTTSPLDEDTILDSVARTGRLVVVDEATPRCGMAGDIAALVAEKAFGALKAPIRRVTAPHTPVPFSPSLEKLYIPSPETIAAAVRDARIRAMSAPPIAITMPKWGLTMTEGKVVGWLKQAGQRFAAGEEILEIETTKITNVFDLPEGGTLRRIVAQAGATLPVGGLLAVVAEEDVPEAEIDAFVAGFAVAAPTEESAVEAERPRELDAAGLRLRYLERGAGDGVPVLLVHGFGADLNSWMFVQPVLAEGRRAIALDLPGHGGSTKEVGGGDVAALTDAVEHALDALDLARAHLVGHSMGGAVVAALALRRPERAASVTLVAGAGLGPEINRAFLDGFMQAARRNQAVEALRLLVHDPALVGRTMVEEVLRYKRLDGVPAALERIAAAWFPDGRQAVDLAAPVAALAVPVQIIWGREDRIIPVAHAEALAGRVPVHILDAAGHLPHMEKAGEVARLIKAFVADHD